MNKTIGFFLLVFFIVGCAEESKPQRDPAVQPAKIFTVGDNHTVPTKIFPGTVQASQRVDLAFQVQGRIIEFPVKDGQQVSKGSLLAKLDDRDYKSALDAAKAEVARNEVNFKRADELIKKHFISQTEYDRLKAKLAISRAELERASKALEDSEMIAPFSGVVAKTYVENFQDVRAKQPILSLQDKSDLEISVYVSETLVARKSDEVKLSITAVFDALPDKTFELYLKEFSTEADPKTQTFEYVLGITDAGKVNILPGMTANVKVTNINENAEDIIATIPLTALVSTANGLTNVWLVDENNKVTPQPITTGELIGQDQVQVTSGLKNGDRIVVAGVSALVDGQEINPINKVRY